MHSKMLLKWGMSKRCFIKKDNVVICFCIFTRKNDFLSLFGSIRVKYYFSFESSFWCILRSSFNKFADSDKSHTVENNEVSSANNLTDDSKFPGRLLMYIKKSSSPNIDPWGTPASTGTHLECCPLRTTLCCLSLRKLWNNLSKFPEIPKVSSLYKRLSCQTLSNALEISRKRPITSSDGLWSKSEQILWTINKSWLTQESLSLKLDCLRESKLLFSRNRKTLKIILWNIFPQTGKLVNCNVGNEIIYTTEVLKSNLCDYNDTYILVRGDITVTAAPEM